MNTRPRNSLTTSSRTDTSFRWASGNLGRGAVFEDVLRRFDSLISRVAEKDGAEVMLFPPAIDRRVLEKSEYLDSFPNLSGAVFSFFGKEAEAAELSGAVRAGKSWEA